MNERKRKREGRKKKESQKEKKYEKTNRKKNIHISNNSSDVVHDLFLPRPCVRRSYYKQSDHDIATDIVPASGWRSNRFSTI